ncbi:MAG: bifunctional glutamate N-acetyltransferase/amino-acid acetyltransferase ArgJ [Cryobacterium sp.]|nr:bifunctional glutamate N-acetyltransferase/amino-acid acetyltransferase ArgJ [Oligoflexia bacterium]
MTTGPGISRTPLPKGFKAGGVNSGVRRYRPDYGVLISEPEAVGVGVFTRNECKAAPIQYCMGLLPSKHVRAIVTNSGQANAATGEEGREKNWRMALSIAKVIGCLPHQVLTASTGVIGKQIEIEKLEACASEVVEKATDFGETFALAILTTDLVPKTIAQDVKLSNGTVRITGICKGSGMIHPNMGTMLGYLLTDAILPTAVAQDFVRKAADVSFNMISVDGDSSTNDCVFLLANGASGVPLANDDDYRIFQDALFNVSKILAQAIARDGEGASKLIQVDIRHCGDEALARKAARGVTVSPLIKTAIHGEDPNWGRILARLGAEGIPAASLDRMTLKIQDHLLFENGAPVEFDKTAVRSSLRSDTVVIDIDLRSGIESATAWGCDLSKRYVDINTDYN